MPDFELAVALDWLVSFRSLVLPYDINPGRHDRRPLPPPPRPDTKASWGAYQWNPPEYSHHSDVDPNASPKPAWQDLQDAWRRWLLEGDRLHAEKLFVIDYPTRHGPSPTMVRRALTDEARLPAPIDIHVGAGLDHMTGLADMLRAAAVAGTALPHIVMRDGDQKRVSIHHTAHLESILQATRHRENVVESAHNVVMDRYHVQARIRDDENETLNNREAAAKGAREIAENYKAHLETEIAAYDPDANPTDLPTLREVLVERLEARAMARIKGFKRAVSQQGVDLAAACDDEADAIKAATVACRTGATHIWSANTVPEAQAAFDTAAAALEAITPLNIPGWAVNGAAAAQVGQTAAFTATTTDRVLAITPVNPSGTGAEGELGTYPGWSFKDVNGQDTGQAVTRSGAALTTTIPADADFPVTATVRGRNGCGDSTLTLTIERPS